MCNIKVFVSHKTRKMVYSSSILTPIQTGRSLAHDVFDEMIGDDVNENISFLNDYFGELSAIYWVWKNYHHIGDPSHVGFMHYRRAFIFNEITLPTAQKINEMFHFEKSDKETWEKIGLDDDNIKKILSSCENIVPQTVIMQETVEAQYKKHHYEKDFGTLKEVLFKIYPDIKGKFLSFCSGYSMKFWVMFVLKKEYFFEYCEWIFPVLFALHKSIRVEGYPDYQKRAIAFLAERLTGFFLMELQSRSACKELPVAFFKSAEPDLKPCFQERFIPIVISSSDYYVPYLSVLLQSLADNSSADWNYDVIVLTSSISEENKYLIKKHFSRKNICIRYARPRDSYEGFPLYGHVSHETYYRLEIPDILQNYNKCIFLDADIILNDSLVDLYNMDVSQYMFAAVRNTMMTLLYNSDKSLRDYYGAHKITMDRYIQAGVLLMNLEMCRRNNFFSRSLEALREEEFRFLDQDLLSFLFNGHILFIENKWNYETYQRCFDDYKYFISQEIGIIRKNALAKARIIHYASPNKPWLFPDEELADRWWGYARKTPYYEICIKRMVEHSYQALPKTKKATGLKFKYYKYCLLSKVTFGKLGKRCMERKDYYRKQLG